MPSFTTKLGLRKPNNTTDFVNVVTDLDDNFDAIDAATGWLICTSTTRPGSPYQGESIYETDTKTYRVWNGTRWSIHKREATSFPPVVTGGPSGYANVGEYVINGDMCTFTGKVTFGSSNGSPGSNYNFALPTGVTKDQTVLVSNDIMGYAWFRDISGPTDYFGFCFNASSTTFNIRGFVANGVFQQGTPVTIASGDWVTWQVHYRIEDTV